MCLFLFLLLLAICLPVCLRALLWLNFPNSGSEVHGANKILPLIVKVLHGVHLLSSEPLQVHSQDLQLGTNAPCHNAEDGTWRLWRS